MINQKAIECLQCPVSKALGDELSAANEMAHTLNERITRDANREYLLGRCIAALEAKCLQLQTENDAIRKESERLIDEKVERIAGLEAALREAMEWDWLTDAPPPKEVVDKCEAALGSEKEGK